MSQLPPPPKAASTSDPPFIRGLRSWARGVHAAVVGGQGKPGAQWGSSGTTAAPAQRWPFTRSLRAIFQNALNISARRADTTFPSLEVSAGVVFWRGLSATVAAETVALPASGDLWVWVELDATTPGTLTAAIVTGTTEPSHAPAIDKRAVILGVMAELSGGGAWEWRERFGGDGYVPGLPNDMDFPGPEMFYGTDASGTLGWYPWSQICALCSGVPPEEAPPCGPCGETPECLAVTGWPLTLTTASEVPCRTDGMPAETWDGQIPKASTAANPCQYLAQVKIGDCLWSVYINRYLDSTAEPPACYWRLSFIRQLEGPSGEMVWYGERTGSSPEGAYTRIGGTDATETITLAECVEACAPDDPVPVNVRALVAASAFSMGTCGDCNGEIVEDPATPEATFEMEGNGSSYIYSGDIDHYVGTGAGKRIISFSSLELDDFESCTWWFQLVCPEAKFVYLAKKVGGGIDGIYEKVTGSNPFDYDICGDGPSTVEIEVYTP